ncbi:MAG: hypothetical protein AB7N91_21385 [Candidatus Tectimicrobiota bacterium]
MATLAMQDVSCVLEAFERNRYFYGKLMTVRDFEQEQRYHMGQRRLINRLLFGDGVLCGLEVQSSGGTTLTIAPGVALDPCGREIIVPEARTYDIADLTDAQGRKIPDTTPVRLCLTYDECTREPVPALKASTCEEVCDYSRIRETYQLHWRAVPTPAVADAGLSDCAVWLNRKTESAENTVLRVQRTTPLWSRANAVCDVAVKVTARQAVASLSLTETPGGGTLIEPAPTPSQFPTPPLSLAAGESFVYVYQVRVGAGPAPVTLSLGLAGMAALPLVSSIEVVSDVEARQREEVAARWFADCSGTGEVLCVDLAELSVGFTGSTIERIDRLDSLAPRRLMYTLPQLGQLLDCVRRQLLEAQGASRPGHVVLTFQDMETHVARPVGATAASGSANTVARGDHVHSLPLAPASGLEFTPEQALRINGEVGGPTIAFQHPVSGQEPTEGTHLATRHYVDSSMPTAGDGLREREHVFAVGQGAGITVQADDVAVRFAPTAPPPVGLHPVPGNDDTVARGDHGHVLALAPASGLEFTTDLWLRGSELRINGEVGGPTIVFQHPVSGQEPTEDGHLATKRYVDSTLPTAGDGLTIRDQTLVVGQGAGITVQADDVGVRFATALPQPVGLTPSAGNDDTVARGDHVHALPELSSTGVVIFPEAQPGRAVLSELIDPELGRGPVSVILGLEQERDGMVGSGAAEILELFKLPRVLLGAGIVPAEGRFQVGVLSQEERVITIRVRWWAFRPGKHLGEVVVRPAPTVPPRPTLSPPPTLPPDLRPTLRPEPRPTLTPGPTLRPEPIVPTPPPVFDPVDFPGRRVDEVQGLTAEHVARLERAGMSNLATLASTEPGRLAEILGVSDVLAMSFVDEAQRRLRS